MILTFDPEVKVTKSDFLISFLLLLYSAVVSKISQAIVVFTTM